MEWPHGSGDEPRTFTPMTSGGMKMRRIYALVLVTMIVAATLAACSSGNGSTDQGSGTTANPADTATTSAGAVPLGDPSAEGSLEITGATNADWMNSTWRWKSGDAINTCSDLVVSITLTTEAGDYGFLEVSTVDDPDGDITFGSGRLSDPLTGSGGKVTGELVGTQYKNVTVSVDDDVSGGDVTAHVKGKFSLECG